VILSKAALFSAMGFGVKYREDLMNSSMELHGMI
jgi:hypothetical protein